MAKLKLVSFNVNGIRARPHQLQALRDRHAPAIIGLQETKVQDPDFPREAVAELGYEVHYHGQKSHYGVALLSRLPVRAARCGYPFDGEDAQRRVVTGTYELPGGGEITVINAYFPQGENRDHAVKFPAKRRFYADMLKYLEQEYSPDRNLVLMGDMNVAPVDQDIGIGADNARRWLREGKTSFLPEEREWYRKLIDWGLVDSFRHCHPETDDRFSWFDYRSRGFERDPRRGLRIDLILATPALIERCVDAGIDYDIRALEKPSDHCPVWVEIEG
ncbi:exodeoxyribonuclease III [Thiohalobacter thiocyanaticus]|uniref:Exodeoxyribonuclease III n=1 Tax=Thiohalobacter thiocyanaticus TaxID=585455 RepID=A0A426QI22_9GAMM|nr:exodeoxyribonuclease III [Thiohalobacter thiocyanaticus]RRQ21397.1 exodeoxyribonuclease III [Thiohalobacter thiocyanaticus]